MDRAVARVGPARGAMSIAATRTDTIRLYGATGLRQAASPFSQGSFWHLPSLELGASHCRGGPKPGEASFMCATVVRACRPGPGMLPPCCAVVVVKERAARWMAMVGLLVFGLSSVKATLILLRSPQLVAQPWDHDARERMCDTAVSGFGHAPVHLCTGAGLSCAIGVVHELWQRRALLPRQSRFVGAPVFIGTWCCWMALDRSRAAVRASIEASAFLIVMTEHSKVACRQKAFTLSTRMNCERGLLPMRGWSWRDSVVLSRFGPMIKMMGLGGDRRLRRVGLTAPAANSE